MKETVFLSVQAMLLLIWYTIPAAASAPWWVIWFPTVFIGTITGCILFTLAVGGVGVYILTKLGFD